MDNRKHIHRHNRQISFSYPISFWQRIHSAFTPFILLIILFLILKIFSIIPSLSATSLSSSYAGAALFATFSRLLIAYVFSLILSIPLALLVEKSLLAERIFLPLFDIAQSIPVLAFFPIIVLLFIKSGFINGAAIFVIFLSMLWNIVFSLVGGLKVIPNDIKAAAQVFNIRGFSFVQKILLPAVVPYLITSSLLAWAQGWNIIIVAEVLHTYIPGGTANQDLFGIGSVLVNAASAGQTGTFLVAIIVMVGAIAILNFLVWQKLLHYAERFKFE